MLQLMMSPQTSGSEAGSLPSTLDKVRLFSLTRLASRRGDRLGYLRGVSPSHSPLLFWAPRKIELFCGLQFSAATPAIQALWKEGRAASAPSHSFVVLYLVLYIV